MIGQNQAKRFNNNQFQDPNNESGFQKYVHTHIFSKASKSKVLVQYFAQELLVLF